jgi:Ni/Co efflux regulator RcnB
MIRSVLVLAALALAATPAAAEPGGKPHRQAEQGRATDWGSVIITAAEQALIREYFQQHPMGNVASLPPGIQKKLARGKPLPPGIAKKFPAGLSGRLPPRPGYAYRVVGADVLLVEVATGVIVDLVRDLVR